MYGSQLNHRPEKIARKDTPQTSTLVDALREEFTDFVRAHSDILLGRLFANGATVLSLTYNITAKIYDGGDFVHVDFDGRCFVKYQMSERGLHRIAGDGRLSVPAFNALLHFCVTLLPLWKEAVETRDYESFACARVLRWIGGQLPEWRDIFSDKFQLK
jgi:hypothetical protein